MPILEVDGKTCVQTGAIARYCGKQSGLYPRDDDWAAAKIDEIIDTATDITVAVGKTMRMDDAAAKAAGRAELAATTLPKYLTALEDDGGERLNRLLRRQQDDHRRPRHVENVGVDCGWNS